MKRSSKKNRVPWVFPLNHSSEAERKAAAAEQVLQELRKHEAAVRDSSPDARETAPYRRLSGTSLTVRTSTSTVPVVVSTTIRTLALAVIFFSLIILIQGKHILLHDKGRSRTIC